MMKALSPDAIDTLRHLNDMQAGAASAPVPPPVVAELLGAGLVAKAGRGDGVEITCDGRKYLSGDCD
ncbi:hypothetical protein [Paraburkholderia rhizosphaerae]|uniref:Uncharacterized protein n=1 Tax=Paraburkholderia rhizosphaerae TaxID=480658 RepID=A0A4R8LYH3_9BURK|nr:hypothetical protein [Paraburkholderia rhizosphaerae]TDY53015.1 hypothetical protein BX592_104302 [Paraburkholderia rhizosphaerae]